MSDREIFRLVLIKPSHYDHEGYVIQWMRSAIPSNTLATLNGIAVECQRDQMLGPDVEIVIDAYDETNTRIRPDKIARDIEASGGKGMVGLIGVQSNQFPRAVEISRQLIERGVQVCIGGFHVSGCTSMLPELPPDIQAALDMGVSIYCGEAEGRLDEVLRDAYAGTLKPVYNYMKDLPGLEGATVPLLPEERVKRTAGAHTSFDSGRGCPFQCSFCTIINVQGRKSRYRTADDIEGIVRSNLAQGVNRFFITDDNFARNKNWEGIFDRLIELREGEGLDIAFIIQVDTLCHQIPNFVAKAGRAGCTRVYIGLENINPDNLIAAKKRQNRITEYRKMLQMWKSVGAMTYCGYIIGFPGDTQERVLRDVEIIKNELPVDLLEFFCLTPLPGSEDHKNLHMKGIPMDPDMNIYDLEHVCTAHPLMSKDEWQGIYYDAWDKYYSDDHVATLMKRVVVSGNKPERIWAHVLQFAGCMRYEKVHPLQGGYFRRKVRTQRRSGLPIESALAFYPKRLAEILGTYVPFAIYALRMYALAKWIKWSPATKRYHDLALTPVDDAEHEDLEMLSHTEAAQAAVAKAQGEAEARAKQAEKQAAVAAE